MLLRLLFLILLAGCGGSNPPPGTIVIGVEAYPSVLDPRQASDALSSKINRLIYNGLLKLDENLVLRPELAESVTQADARTIDVVLRPHLFFQDQTPLTASDVVGTYRSILENDDLHSPHTGVFEKIERFEIIDDLHFKLHLKENFAPFLAALTMGIVPEEMAMLPPAQFKPIGAGPYRLKEFLDREKVVLTRNDRYWGKPPKNTDIVFRTLTDDTLRTMELIKGRLSLVQNGIPHPLLPAVKKEESLALDSGDGINVSYMGFNLKDPILSKLKVREAISVAINRADLIRYKLSDMVTPAESLLSPKHWAYAPLPETTFDPEKAKRLLDEAGFPDPDGDGPLMRFPLVYKTSTKRDRVELALLIGEQLKQVGIGVEVKPYEWGTFFRDIRQGNFQIYTLTWVGVTEPDLYYLALHTSQIPPVGLNRGVYSNVELDKLLEAGRTTVDLNQRKEIYKTVQEQVAHDKPFIPLWYEDNYVVRQRGLEGYTLRPDAGFEGVVDASVINASVINASVVNASVVNAVAD